MNDDGMRAGTSRMRAAALLAVALVSLAAYANTLTNDLVFDDLALIPEQPAIRDAGNLWAIVTSTYWGEDDSLYRPLTLWSLSVNYGLNRAAGLPGEHPVGYHVVNVLLHLTVCCCLLVLLRKLGLPEWTAVVAALLFAVHPLHTEAVAPVVGRSELLAALGGLGFLLLHRQRTRVPAGALCLLLAVTAKESAVAFFPLALWMDICLRRPGAAAPRSRSNPASHRRWWWAGYASYGSALVGWLVLRAAVVPAGPMRIPPIDNPLVQASVFERWITAAGIQLDYLRLQLVPAGLSSDYSFNQIPVLSSPLDARVLLFVAVILAAGWLAWSLRRTMPIVTFAVTGYALLFFLTSNFPFPIGTIMGERLAYAPSLFTCLLLAHAAWKLREKWGGAVTVGVAVILVLFAGLTVQRNDAWADPERHLQALLRSAPRNAKAHWMLARQEIISGRLEPAADAARQALAIHPGYAEAWNDLGTALAGMGDLAQSVKAFERATGIHPGFADAWYRLGLSLQSMERLDEAAESYSTAISVQPDLAPALANLGSLRAAEGRFDEAEALLRRALEADPNHATARNYLNQLQELRESE